MFFLAVLQSFILIFLCAKASIVPFKVKYATEHQIVVRSTPSLDSAEEILEKFGSENQMNLTDMEDLFKSIGLAVLSDKDTQGLAPSSGQMCFTSQHFYGMYSRNDGNINRTDLIELCPAVLYQMTKQKCRTEMKKEIHVEEEEEEGKENPSRAWGFGFLFVTIISFGSLIGAFVVPLMEKSFYKKTLMCMVSLAVGVLSGSGIFHLIPSALGFPFDDDDTSYIWKCVMISIGVYIFLALECVMKLYISFKDIRKKECAAADIAPPKEGKPSSSDSEIHPIGLNNSHSHNGHGHSHHGVTFSNDGVKNKPISNSQTELTADIISTEQIKIPEAPRIATVAWMIIIGDGLHNFIDGLAIGASFSSSVVIGISTSLAVICEELPHELGDFAILLNSGLTYKQAMLANFLSACFCYIGLVIGLVLGYATSAVKYIYGIAGGMFLYISLVNMLPEAMEMAYSLSGNSKSKSIKMLVLVNFVIVFGFCVMLVLALYGTTIEL